jgi:hypothetical protein
MADSISVAVLESMATYVVRPMGAQRVAEFSHHRCAHRGCVGLGKTARIFAAGNIFPETGCNGGHNVAPPPSRESDNLISFGQKTGSIKDATEVPKSAGGSESFRPLFSVIDDFQNDGALHRQLNFGRVVLENARHESARGLAHSGTLRDFRSGESRASVPECGSPLPLYRDIVEAN